MDVIAKDVNTSKVVCVRVAQALEDKLLALEGNIGRERDRGAAFHADLSATYAHPRVQKFRKFLTPTSTSGVPCRSWWVQSS